ncbi:hypothetical protein NPX79_03325 [Spiroplasma endosymbiont of Anurida maritima]|uniref:hypothetical protein n=1 Tax=Spiroplasma endosymbiont of Anurida maritima TaxID=2967972 RepID=UPI0036D322BF
MNNLFKLTNIKTDQKIDDKNIKLVEEELEKLDLNVIVDDLLSFIIGLANNFKSDVNDLLINVKKNPFHFDRLLNEFILKNEFFNYSSTMDKKVLKEKILSKIISINKLK